MHEFQKLSVQFKNGAVFKWVFEWDLIEFRVYRVAPGRIR